jgi:DNA-binding transcriptional MerR regulator
MKKERKTKNYLKLGIFLFGVSLLLWNCEKEEIINTHYNSLYKTVSKKESVTFLQNNITLAKGNTNYLSYDVTKIQFEEITNSNSKLAVIPAKIENNKLYSRILLLKINDTIKSVVYHMYFNKTQQTNQFSGLVTLTDLNGNLKKAFRYLNGIVTNAYKVNKDKLFAKSSTDNGSACREVCGHDASDSLCVCNDQTLDEVEITGTNNNQINYVPVAILYGEDGGIGSINTCEVNCNGWDNGGGGDQTSCPGIKVKDPDTGECKCPSGYIEDFNGNCVIDPCSKIKSENQNPIYSTKINTLKGKTNLKKETGYMQQKDGSYTQLTDTNNGHSLIIPIDRLSTVGFMHTHLDDYLTGEIDEKTGLPKKNKPIRMFSPADILKFLQIVKNTKYNGVPLSSVYGTMVSSSGTYTLRFTGNPNDISNSYDLNKEEFEEYYERYDKNVEKTILNFLKDKVNIAGIELYKIQNNGTVQKKSLSTDGKNVNPEDCN